MKIFIKETNYENSSLISSLLKKRTMKTHHLYLPFYWDSQEKQFLKGILGRKSHCIMIRDKYRTLPNISHGLCEKSQELKTVTYFCKNLYHRGYHRYLLVTSGYLVVTYGYLVVTSGYLIATTGYFWLLLVTSGSSF